ncbi:hypothetical protein KR084_002715, partial [Drosophila pseudotakahashii]
INKLNMFTKSLILLLAAGLLSAVEGSDPVCNFGTTIEKAPWQVSLKIQDSKGCGGVIYDENIILTAAHCVQGRKASDISVSFGSSTWGEGTLIVVHEVIIKDGYKPETTDGSNDIAVLLLSTPIPLGEKAKSINLPDKSPKAGEQAQITGWGANPATLQGANVQIEDHASCKTTYTDSKPSCNTRKIAISEDMICANGKGKGPCGGDEGGPLVSGPDNQLIGLSLVSCADPSIPDVYTNIFMHKDWIEVSAYF